MSEPSLIDLFRSRWIEIARQFWPQSPREQLESKLARLDSELRQRQACLLLYRKKMDHLYYRLKRREHRLAWLSASMDKTPGDADVIAELERQRRSIDRLQERLQECEHGYACRLARLRQRKQQRDELRERLLSGWTPKPKDEQSDPDYPF
jgi:chromosome segregation ATPase